MKLTNLMLLIGTASFAVACDGGSGTCTDETGCEDTGDSDGGTDDDTDETDVEADVTPEWNVGAWDAGDWKNFVDCSVADKVTFTAETKNWGFKPALYITQTDFYGEFFAWDEEHTLDEESASDDNTGDGYSKFERTLDTNADLPSVAADQAADTSTLWGCGDRAAGNPSLDPTGNDYETAFAIAVWDSEDADPETDDPSDCIYFGHNTDELADDLYTGGTGEDGAQRTIPAWFSKSGCTLVE